MNKSLLVALVLLPVVAIGGEQVILKTISVAMPCRKSSLSPGGR